MQTSPTAYHQRRHVVVADALTFQQRLADAIRQIRRSATVRGRAEQQLLKDFARGRGIMQLERLANISRTCTDLADATALAECFRGYALAGHRLFDVTQTEALRAEAAADGTEDQAVFEYLATPCAATRLRAIEALRRAAETSQVAMETLERVG